MEEGRNPVAALGNALRMLGGQEGQMDAQVRQAAWVARCVGRGEAAPLGSTDVSALADVLQPRVVSRDTVVFSAGRASDGVWILREGQLELSLGSGRRRAVLHVLHPGDVEGDIQLLLDMPFPYTAHALSDSVCLFLGRAEFETLLRTRPTIARRWLSSVAMRLATSQARILGLLGHSLIEQVARLLLDEAVDGVVPLPQRTLAAMLGVQRPSLNKVLKDLEHERAIAIRYASIEIIDSRALSRRAA